MKSKYRTKVSSPVFNPAPTFVLTGEVWREVGQENLLDMLILDNLETSLTTPVNKAHVNASGDIVERFIKPRLSIMIEYPAYSLDGPGPSIATSVPYEEFSTIHFVYG